MLFAPFLAALEAADLDPIRTKNYRSRRSPALAKGTCNARTRAMIDAKEEEEEGVLCALFLRIFSGLEPTTQEMKIFQFLTLIIKGISIRNRNVFVPRDVFFFHRRPHRRLEAIHRA
jgi:hypothetical protein